ncbi:M20 family metallopeptidase [Saprospiraceae bacterium]|nr:M20 family metallopeptidase [Saprospiraceae bacterium]
MIDKIKSLSSEFFEEIRSIRRHIHMNPELSFQEVETGKYICQILDNWGIEYQYPVAENGIIALVKGIEGGPVRALRADIDALPIQEINDIDYKSKNEGIMHACGHDVHSSSALGAIKILHTLRNEWKGQVKVLFQPGEEKLPGGASIMIAEGALENPEPEYIVGQHVHPPLEVGKVGFRPKTYMASADEIRLTVIGKGGHAALPQNNVDPILVAANILVQLQQIISRKSNPTIPNVLSFGKINTQGGATNIIPNRVFIEGTFRTMDEAWRKEAHEHIRKICSNIAESMGAICEVDISVGYPCLYNDEKATSKAIKLAETYLGRENVVALPLRMTSEDFAFYSQKIPACFYRLGTGNQVKGITSPVHTNTFNIDEEALKIGMGLMAYLVINDAN